MFYVGGKARVAAEIALQVQSLGRRFVWEPFCGGLNVSTAMSRLGLHVLASDAHPALIALYRAVANGWAPPEQVSEAEYREARSLPVENPMHGFCAFGCSFGAKCWGGYARPNPRNPHQPQTVSRTLRRDVPLIAEIFHCNFFDVRPEPLDLAIYCDPPYQGTTGYATGAFPHSDFWDRVRAWERAGVPVLVSEYGAPSDFTCVWSAQKKRLLAGGTANDSVTERLFRWGSIHRA